MMTLEELQERITLSLGKGLPAEYEIELLKAMVAVHQVQATQELSSRLKWIEDRLDSIARKLT